MKRERAESGTVRLEMLGRFSVSSAGQVLRVPQTSQRLIAFLALQPGPVMRECVASTLWPDSPQPQAQASLRSALWRLRRTRERILTVADHTMGLVGGTVVDTVDIAEQVNRLVDLSEPCEPSDLDIAKLARDLLPGWADDWLLIERERIRQICLHGLEAICDRLRKLGKYGGAVEAGLAAVQKEPLRESAHRALVAVHLAEGNHSEALRQYEWFTDYLRSELHIAPSSQFRALVAPLLRERHASTTSR